VRKDKEKQAKEIFKFLMVSMSRDSKRLEAIRSLYFSGNNNKED